MLGLGIGFVAKVLWDALNQKGPDPGPGMWADAPSTTIMFPAQTAIRVTVLWQATGSVRDCGNNNTYPINVGPGGGTVISGWIHGFRVRDTQTRNASGGCGAVWALSGPQGAVDYLDASGNVIGGVGPLVEWGSSYLNSEGTVNGNVGVSVTDFFTGQTYNPPGGERAPLPEQVRPGAPATQDAESFPRLPAPAAEPVPTILPAAVPGSSPIPAPAAVPSGLPAGQPVTTPTPTITPTRQPTPQRSTPGSQPQTITATGVTTAPPPALVVPTPAEAVLIGGQLVGGPGSSPPQGPGGTAAEMGRLEGKSELALSKLGQLGPLLESLDVLQALGEWLLSANGGVTYTLQPPCGTDANGDPLPPVEVVVPPTVGVEVATIARLDALAMLIDEHKQMRQPICKGKPTGSPVTVTAVEVE